MAGDRREGLVRACKAAACLYQAHLRRLLGERLGVAFEPVVNGHAEALGVPRVVIDLFSKRRAEITELLAESGNRSAKAAQVATLETRRAKHYGVEAETLTEQWAYEAAAVGFGVEQVAACFGRDRQRFPEPASIEAFFEALAGAHGMTERSSTFRRSDVLEVCASAFGASATAAELEGIADRFLASDRVLFVDRPDRTGRTAWNLAQTSAERATAETPAAQSLAQSVAQSLVPRSATQRLYTVPGLVELEARLLASANPAQRTATVLRSEVVDGVISQRGELSAEQQMMVRAVCGSDEFIQSVSGRPGAGKTYALEAVVSAHVNAGVPIIGCAVSATAAAELERQAGFARSTGAQAGTVARLLLDLGDRHSYRLAASTVVVVDEASMLGTRDLARLADYVRHVGGAIRLVGDPDQHGSVDVGGVFRRLCADRGDRLIRLVENNRQQDQGERLAIAEYRDGHIADALARYDDADQIVRSPTTGASLDAMTADWYAARLSGQADPMIAGPNSTRQALNARARTLLKATGELVGEPLVIAGREFMIGDEVVARRNDRHLQDPQGHGFVKNGSTGTITDIDLNRREVVVAFEPEGTIRIPNEYLSAGRLEHGYALSSFEEGYVALTRGRQHSRIYIVEGGQTEADNDELTHTTPDPRRVEIGDIAQALGRRRSGHMAADASPDLDAVARTLVGASLAHLAARRRQLRVAAVNNTDSAVRDLLGPEPATQRDRLAWRRAVEATAVYNARYPRRAGLTGDSASGLVPRRPAREPGSRPRLRPDRIGDQHGPGRKIDKPYP